MSEITVNGSGIIFASGFIILLPFILSFIWIKYYKGTISSILIGIVGFIGSVGVETLFLVLLTQIFDKTSMIITIIGLISPGLFEETGRYICLNYLLKKNKLKNISVCYGIGHGGIESIFVGLASLSYLFTKDILIEKGVLKESITFLDCLMGALERISAVIIHISLSVIVYKAVKEKIIYYYIFSIIYHDFVDFFAFLKAKNYITSIFIVELIVGILALSIGFYSYRLYNRFEDKKEEEEKEKILPLKEKNELSINNSNKI